MASKKYDPKTGKWTAIEAVVPVAPPSPCKAKAVKAKAEIEQPIAEVTPVAEASVTEIPVSEV